MNPTPSSSPQAGDRHLRHVIVSYAAGQFAGWPANTGIWNWGNEIVVGFSVGAHEFNADGHSIDRRQPLAVVLARSLDGGESWTVEEHPELDNKRPSTPLPDSIDFTQPAFAFRCWHGRFWYSYDRGKTWAGPHALGDFGMPQCRLTGRTDYLVSGKREALLFLSAEVDGVKTGPYKDHAFCARTRDGGRTFQFESWINGEPGAVRAVMPATVRVSDAGLVTVVRRRYDIDAGNAHCWLDAYGSPDDGHSWELLSRIAYTELGTHNGNPPSLVRLPDGRLCAAYGFRAVPYGMRAKLSADNGRSWGPEITLRDDAATWDFGYPRSVVRPDGKVVTVYYYTTQEHPEQHIAATIWDAR